MNPFNAHWIGVKIRRKVQFINRYQFSASVKAVDILWDFRGVDLSKVNKLTTPVDFLTLDDGRQVLVMNKKISELLKQNSIIDS